MAIAVVPDTDGLGKHLWGVPFPDCLAAAYAKQLFDGRPVEKRWRAGAAQDGNDFGEATKPTRSLGHRSPRRISQNVVAA